MSDTIQREKIEKLHNTIKQVFFFTEHQCRQIENKIEELISVAACGGFKKTTVDEVPLRTKYFFGEGYTYGHQLIRKGRGMERLYPEGYVDPIPSWISNYIIKPLINANLIPENFVNSVAINDYLPGGCIVSHIDPPHIFDRPIISLSLFSDSALCFGCKFEFKPIRCSEPVLRLTLPRGILTFLSGFSANEISHCVRPEDTKYRRAVILLRRVFPNAPRLIVDSPFPDVRTFENDQNYRSRPEKFIDFVNYGEKRLKKHRKRQDSDKSESVSDKILRVQKASFKKYSKSIRKNENATRQILDKKKVFFANNLIYLKKPYVLENDKND